MQQFSFVSYPRSGSHFLCYCIEKVFNIKTIRSSRNIMKVFKRIHSNYLHDVEIYKNHGCSEQHLTVNSKSDGLIYIIRNYKECIIRRLKTHDSNYKFEDIIEDMKDKSIYVNDRFTHTFDYIRTLKYFDNFPKPKIIIYYEDLVTDLENELKKIKTYFFSSMDINVPDTNIDDFMLEKDKHKQKSIDEYNYEVERNGSHSGGRDTLFHSKHLDLDTKTNMDIYLKKHFPELFERYLTRYEEKHIIN